MLSDPAPEERLAAGEGDPHPLPDRVQVFPGERENVGQEGFDALAGPPVSLADSPSPPKAAAPAPGQDRSSKSGSLAMFRGDAPVDWLL